MEPVIHHHFKICKKFFENPRRFNTLKFKSIPCFKLYPMLYLKRIRELIEVLSYKGMPHEYQQIINQLKPPTHVSANAYREELVFMTYCTYNRQSFFVRAYKMRANAFFKVEVTLHSKTLGKGKYYSLERAYRSAIHFFNRIEEGAIPTLNPQGNHSNDYFYLTTLQEEVGVYEELLFKLKQANNRKEREFLKGKLINQISEFQSQAQIIAEKNLEIMRVHAPTEYDNANQNNE